MKLLGFLLVWAMLLSPILAAMGSFIFVTVVCRRKQAGVVRSLVDIFFRYMVPWGMAGFGVAFLGVVVLTIVTGSPQGPLSLIVYGPVGIALGIVVGSYRWFRSSNRGQTTV